MNLKSFLLKVYYIFLKIIDHVSILNNKIISYIIKPPSVRTTSETIDKIIKDKCSISRYGDGEFTLMSGKNLIFQQYCDELSLRLREIIRGQKENHIVCIPNVFNGLDWYTEKSKNYWIKYLNLNRGKIYKMINIKKEYYDSLVTRLYIDYKDKTRSELYFEKIRSLWNDKDIVIVEGEQSRLGVGNDLFGNVNSIKRIICPSFNAFSKYNRILDEVLKQDKSKLILIALGPSATVLAYDLSVKGYQAIDIGHIDIEYEWFLQKATERCPVKNKYIGEVPNGTKVDPIFDVRYENEIIEKIL